MGLWNFLNLVSKKRFRRLQWKRMVTIEEFSSKMNAFMEKVNGASQDTPDTADLIGEQEDQLPDAAADKRYTKNPVGRHQKSQVTKQRMKYWI
jgi:hypothetical protein